MRLNQNIFKAYDIRGKFPAEFDESAAERIGEAIADFFRRKEHAANPRLLVCRDVRNTSARIQSAVERGLMRRGARVLHAGIGTTPYFYFLMHRVRNLDGGMMITASHNPPEYNGLKIRDKQCRAIARGSGLEKIQALALASSPSLKKQAQQDSGTKANLADMRDQYVRFLVKNIRFAKTVRVAIDAGGGSTAFILPGLLKRTPALSYQPLFFTPEGSFKKHSPNPLDPVAQQTIKKEMARGKFDFGVIFDGDGDRVVFFDERGKRVRSEYILGLFAQAHLRRRPGAAFVMPINAAKGVREWIIEHHGKMRVSKVGYASVHQELVKSRGVYATEVSGHFYFREFFSEDSALFAFLRLAVLISRAKRPLSALIEPFERYVWSEETNFSVDDKDAALARMRKKYRDANLSFLDGVTVEYPDWWCNVRASNTEPLMRLILEAKTTELFEEKMNEVTAVIIAAEPR